MRGLIKNKADYVRNWFFGMEDGFVSTAGVMFGIATATNNKAFVLIAGVVTVLVEATSMGIGAYLSEESANEIEKKSISKPVIDGVVMFFAYTLAGTYCVIPYAIFDPKTGMTVSVVMTLIALFFLGYLPRRDMRRGVQVLILGGIAVLIGYAAGEVLSKLVA